MVWGTTGLHGECNESFGPVSFKLTTPAGHKCFVEQRKAGYVVFRNFICVGVFPHWSDASPADVDRVINKNGEGVAAWHNYNKTLELYCGLRLCMDDFDDGFVVSVERGDFPTNAMFFVEAPGIENYQKVANGQKAVLEVLEKAAQRESYWERGHINSYCAQVYNTDNVPTYLTAKGDYLRVDVDGGGTRVMPLSISANPNDSEFKLYVKLLLISQGIW